MAASYAVPPPRRLTSELQLTARLQDLKVRDASLEPLARCMLVDPRGCPAGIDGSLCAQMYLMIPDPRPRDSARHDILADAPDSKTELLPRSVKSNATS